MLINAELVEKKICVELPVGSSDLSFLDGYLRKNGYVFNRAAGRFEYACSGISRWHMRCTPRKTIISTFEGKDFPLERKVRGIVYPAVPRHEFVIKGEREDSDRVIGALFKNRFEVVFMSEQGKIQKFYNRRGEKAALAYKMNGHFVLGFSGLDPTARLLLQSFELS
jgi:hypothetical protein